MSGNETAAAGGLLQELLERIGPTPEEEKQQYSDGIRKILEHIVTHEPKTQKVDRKALEAMIVKIDQ